MVYNWVGVKHTGRDVKDPVGVRGDTVIRVGHYLRMTGVRSRRSFGRAHMRDKRQWRQGSTPWVSSEITWEKWGILEEEWETLGWLEHLGGGVGHSGRGLETLEGGWGGTPEEG